MKQENSLVNLLNDAEKWKSNQQFDLDNLQKQNNYRKEFIGNLSHELKTPLFSIQGYIETLLDGGINDANINIAYLKKAVNNIERLSAIVKDVDTIAKVESDALNLNKTNFNILDLVKNTSENLELFADKNDVELIVNENSKSAKVFADKEKIKTILVNLITNAIKYGKENGTTNILVSVVMNRVVVEISDNGIGIKEDQLPRVFERFYRIDSNRSREQGGSGLGLAIVKHIIEAHNENINLKSTFGEGTIVTFTLKKI
ncbi:MAG: sensor histidine kinase [Chitinophagales bacterium]